ncbi:alcohol dehydrogenase [Paenibacillus baekrokdamisoli]|uniref:Alcohol dehydrogenase n=1 Tax=Paenibacillus baekrokdamisoli TaxID=1712516 RepID=A0A3G9IP32_9BACL|nr:galactitol-1-phosphate 5-dehydrogenase [Paenibacillus baekrokdamisoli]MBB3070035.1 2-desacetyl-2-hydroxyethyl bacteriochlorophyllide A dehydrogenase [Paenibacillus baekrokdamisoli]BBH20617.1 alcohol dehydrogenase [Paenibacillus baekrokdamisoli]
MAENVETNMMRALVYEGPRTMNMRTVPIPEPGEQEVLIRVERVGICGSELGGYLGHNSLRKPPLIMGHEFSGVIVKTGTGANKLGVGARVTVNPLQTCGQCSDCLHDNHQLCQQRKLLGAHLPGAFAEYVVVAEPNVYPIPDSLSFEEAALTEPFACAVHLCRLISMKRDDSLLIMGAGPIGLFALTAARTLGLSHIIVSDLNPDRLKIVTELGGIPAHSQEELAAWKPADGFHAAIDAVGMQVTRQQCVESVRRGGRVGFTGLHEADSTLPVNTIIREELKLFGAFAYAQNDFETALRFIAEGKVNLLPWTVHQPLEQGSACFEKLISGPGAIAKIMLYL